LTKDDSKYAKDETKKNSFSNRRNAGTHLCGNALNFSVQDL
jgi:hypothetical protein